MTKEEYTKDRPLRVVTLCSGYDSQCMALERLKRDFPGFDYDCIAWAEIDRYAIRAHDAVFPQYKDRNMGDITSCDWSKITQPVDLLIYSTPCTSISNAGKQEGLKKDSGTASSIIWSVLNAIDTLKPRFLLMENVKALVSKKFMPDFREWYNELASRGYQNFWKVLNAKDYCVPQNRERVFMVSILDEDASFHFPEPFPLKKRLKDVLEEEVDERYYLSDRTVDKIIDHCERKQSEGCGFSPAFKDGSGIATAITTLYSQRQTDTFIKEPVVYDDYNSRVAEDQSVMGTVTPNCGTSAPRNGYKIIEPRIAASQGRYPKNPSDREAGCPTEQRLEIGGDISNTVTTVEKDSLVVEPAILTPTLSTNKGEGMKILPSEAGFRIRKLTEREVFRLMDVSEDDIDRIQAAGISRSQQYKMAGNSIVTNVLYHIFRKMFIDTECESEQLSIF